MANVTVETPFYEAALARHFPAWHARRERARAQSAAMSSFRGSIGTRTSRSWDTSRSYAMGSRSDRWAQVSMRDRARQVHRDNPIGRSLLEKETQYVVGNGYALQANTSSPEFNTEVEALWTAWIDQADVRGMFSGAQLQQMGWRQSRKDGDGGFVLLAQGDKSRIQFLPGDLIQTPHNRFADKSMFDGVEVDAAMRPRRFHVTDLDQDGRETFREIDARDFVYLPHLDDPLAVRGCTCYQTIFELLDQLDGYVDAVIIAARMAAVFGLIFKEKSAGKSFGALPSTSDGEGVDQRAVRLEHGLVKYAGTEDSVAQVQAQQPMQQTPQFIQAVLRLVGLPFDMPLEIAAQDLSTVNFSGARVGLIGFYRACLMKRSSYITRCWDRIYQWWVSREARLGHFKAQVPADFWAHEFQGQEYEMNDRLAEAQADLLEVEMGISSLKRCSSKRGRDHEETQAENEREMTSRAEKKLPDMPASSYTRDRMMPTQPTTNINFGSTDPKLATVADGIERARLAADAYGVAVRAGAVTPQIEDEEHFRQQLTIPPPSGAVKEVWKDETTRRPITLAVQGGGAPTITPPADTQVDDE